MELNEDAHTEALQLAMDENKVELADIRVTFEEASELKYCRGLSPILLDRTIVTVRTLITRWRR